MREREILRVAAALGGSDGEQAGAAARQSILKWAERRTGGQLPGAAWSHAEFDHLAGGRNCAVARIVDESLDVWAIRADVPDKTVAQRVWTTEAVVGRKPGHGSLFSLRLLVSSPESELQIEPAVPKFVHEIADSCGLYSGTKRLTSEPSVIWSEEDAKRLIDVLVDPDRVRPVFVLTTPDYSTDPYSTLLDPSPLARATIGLAEVVVLPARFTWALTERFGKRLSVFGGAARVYRPGFAEDANPYAGHELILAERLSGDENALRVSALLRQIAATESIRQLRLGQEVLSFSVVREQSLDAVRARLEAEGAADVVQLRAAHSQINKIKDDVRRLKEEQLWVLEEHKLAEDRAATAETQLRAASFRIQQLLEQLRVGGESPDINIQLPSLWDEFSDWCERNLVGRVLLSPRARREVKSPEFREVGTAARCLLWLANAYRDRRLEGGDGDLRVSVEPGIQNDRCGADSFRFDWQGKRNSVEWHIKNGGNTRDRSRCLRIYYFWDESSHQVVVASMPGHITTGAS
ncbi:MAG: hypothetical protein J0H14_13230 [Alphaproteobacteria bacterium]|nr:hypothetical protein [Alphaproteobacteria bacterium]